MYAIVEIAGQQYKVEKNQEIFVHRLEGKEGSNVDFGHVLLIDNNGKVVVGAPDIKGAAISPSKLLPPAPYSPKVKLLVDVIELVLATVAPESSTPFQ